MGSHLEPVLAAAALLGLTACGSDASVADAVSGSRRGRARPQTRVEIVDPSPIDDYDFDGFELGDPFEEVKGRIPFLRPCVTRALRHSPRQVVFYGARRCKTAFPERSSALFFVGEAEPASSFRARVEPAIEAFGWFGGAWFSDRSDFPLHVGDPDTSASPTLGPPRYLFELFRQGSPRTLIVRGHPRDVWSLSDGILLVGFVVGPMPDMAFDEQWQTLLELYERHASLR